MKRVICIAPHEQGRHRFGVSDCRPVDGLFYRVMIEENYRGGVLVKEHLVPAAYVYKEEAAQEIIAAYADMEVERQNLMSQHYRRQLELRKRLGA